MKKILFLILLYPIFLNASAQSVRPTASITDPNPGAFINILDPLDPMSTNAGTASQPLTFRFVTGNLTNPVGWKTGTGLEISANGINWTDTITFTGGAVISGTVYVRIASTTNAGSYSGNIHGASSTQASANEPYTATVTAVSTVSASPSSFTGMTSTAGNLGGSVTSLVTGSALTGNITVGPLGGFKISLDNISFANTQTITPISGAVSQNIYIALSDTNTSGLHSGNLPISGGGASTFNIAVSGTTSAPATTPDSVRFMFGVSSGLALPGWQQVLGDPGTGVRSGAVSGTTITYTTVSTNVANWKPWTDGTCASANNGVTNATIPYSGSTGAMKEAFYTQNVLDVTNPQFVVGGLKTDGTTYDVEISGTTQYAFSCVTNYNVRGTSLGTSQNLNAHTNTSTKVTFTSVRPDASGNISIYMGRLTTGEQIGLLSYIIIRKH